MPIEREPFLEKSPTQYFVHGVMPSDILAQRKQLAFVRENPGSMQTPGAAKSFLRITKLRRQIEENFARDRPFRFDRFEVLVDGLNGRLATQTATR